MGNETAREVLTEAVHGAEKASDAHAVLLLAVKCLLSLPYCDHAEASAKRRGLEEDALVKGIPSMTLAQLQGLLVELALRSGGPLYESYSGKYSPALTLACDTFGVDLKAFHDQNMKAQLAEDAKERQKKAAKEEKQTAVPPEPEAAPGPDAKAIH